MQPVLSKRRRVTARHGPTRRKETCEKQASVTITEERGRFAQWHSCGVGICFDLGNGSAVHAHIGLDRISGERDA